MSAAVLGVLTAWHILTTLAVVSKVGKECKPLTPNTAVWAVLINGAIVGLLVWVQVNH